MNLEQQVTSLEISHRLKELGVSQKSIAGWRLRHITDGNKEKISSEWMIITKGFVEEWEGEESIAAFTVAELGEMLPDMVTSNKDFMMWIVRYIWKDESETKAKGFNVTKHFCELTEADARGKCLIYLIENGLYDVQKSAH